MSQSSATSSAASGEPAADPSPAPLHRVAYDVHTRRRAAPSGVAVGAPSPADRGPSGEPRGPQEHASATNPSGPDQYTAHTKVKYDLVVVGGGPIGLATAYASAKAGKKVLVLERFVFSNSQGSSSDMARMFRTCYTEDFMADLAQASLPAWDELAREAGEGMLVWMTGLLNFGDPAYGAGGPEGTLTGPIANLQRLHMPYEQLTRAEIEQRYPFRNLPDNYIGLFAPQNGVINVPLLTQTLRRLCVARGVTLLEHVAVQLVAVDETGASVTARLGNGQVEVFRADKVALTSGAYVNDVLRPSFGVEIDLHIWEMMYAYFTVNNEALFPSMWFCFAEDDPPETGASQPSNLIYGFPALPWALQSNCRIAVDAASRVIRSPWERRPEPCAEDIEKVQAFLAKHLPQVQTNPSFAGSCLQTNVFDNMFAFGLVPGTHSRVAVFTAGWAMKMVPLIGSLMSAMLFGHLESSYPHLAPIVDKHFSLERVDPSTKLPLLHPVVPQSQSLQLSTDYVPRHKGGSSAMAHAVAASAVAPTLPAVVARASALSAVTPHGELPKPNLLAAQARFSTGAYALALVAHFKRAHPGLQGVLHSTAPVVPRSVAGIAASVAAPTAVPALRVGIVGAGMAGLYAGFILQALGIGFEILEAAPRIGGRVFTHRFAGFRDEPGTPAYYQYFDVGAMRFPVIPTMRRLVGGAAEASVDTAPDDADVRRYRFGLIHQLNEQRDKAQVGPIVFEPYILSDAAQTSLVQYNGITLRREQIQTTPTTPGGPVPDQFHFGEQDGGHVPPAEIARGADALTNAVYAPLVTSLMTNFGDGFQALLAVDKFTVRTFMRERAHYSDRAITWLETVNSATGLYEEAFTESVMDAFDFSGNKWVCVAGGTGRIVDVMVSNIQAKSGPHAISTNCMVTRVAPSPDHASMQVVVEHRAPGGAQQQAGTPAEETKSFSHVILTTTLAAMRTMDLSACHLSSQKLLALRTLHYDQSVKVGLLFRRRWWQDQTVMKGKAIFGGTSVTDSPIRVVVYPSYGLQLGLAAPGVLIVSYTWSQDAGRLGSLEDAAAVRLCLRCLRDLHSDAAAAIDAEFTGEYFVHSWHDDPLMNGAFALYGPTQFSSLYPSLVVPEVGGRLHVAGEAASVHHAWIVGSLNSAYRSVWEILGTVPGLRAKRCEMLAKFGRIDEVEYGEDLQGGEDEWTGGQEGGQGGSTATGTVPLSTARAVQVSESQALPADERPAMQTFRPFNKRFA